MPPVCATSTMGSVPALGVRAVAGCVLDRRLDVLAVVRGSHFTLVLFKAPLMLIHDQPPGLPGRLTRSARRRLLLYRA